MDSRYHEPVLLNESTGYLLNNKDNTLSRVYVDCTLGGGGYTKKILELTSSDTKVIAIDRDVHSIEYCKVLLKDFSERIIYVQDNFAAITDILNSRSINKVSGVVMDLGLSSYQLNEEDGFSYQKDTALDMRADKIQSLKASDVLNDYDEDELHRIFKEYGELKYSRQITRDIVAARKLKRFETTFDLVETLKEKIPPRFLNKDLSKAFQAIRIEVNGELDNLKKALVDAAGNLEQGARIVAVSYHSLEDRIVKNFFRASEELKAITKKPVEPKDEEVGMNVRSRSGKLRAAQKI
jgi:16S rRNA (cytosine1402-N4)-methyltransferase